MSSREIILGTVERNQPPAAALPEVPLFDPGLTDPWRQFQEALERMGGKVWEPSPGADPTGMVKAIRPDAKVVCSATPEVPGTRHLSDVGAPRDLDDVDVGVVRAEFGVAETGSVFLSDASLGVRALGYLPQHLVVLLDPTEIVGNLHQAYARPEFAKASYAVLMTGPSATADIEGVLIHGAQGVRTLTVVPLSRPSG
jgi:L-lactate dehydrogenase complex protein LldG